MSYPTFARKTGVLSGICRERIFSYLAMVELRSVWVQEMQSSQRYTILPILWDSKPILINMLENCLTKGRTLPCLLKNSLLPNIQLDCLKFLHLNYVKNFPSLLLVQNFESLNWGTAQNILYGPSAALNGPSLFKKSSHIPRVWHFHPTLWISPGQVPKCIMSKLSSIIFVTGDENWDGCLWWWRFQKLWWLCHVTNDFTSAEP